MQDISHGFHKMKGIKIKNKISKPKITLAAHLSLLDSLIFSVILLSVFPRAPDREFFACPIWTDRDSFGFFIVFVKSAVSSLLQFSKLVFSK